MDDFLISWEILVSCSGGCKLLSVKLKTEFPASAPASKNAMGGGAFLVLPSPCPTTRMITASFFPLLKLWDRCEAKSLLRTPREVRTGSPGPITPPHPPRSGRRSSAVSLPPQPAHPHETSRRPAALLKTGAPQDRRSTSPARDEEVAREGGGRGERKSPRREEGWTFRSGCERIEP